MHTYMCTYTHARTHACTHARTPAHVHTHTLLIHTPLLLTLILSLDVSQDSAVCEVYGSLHMAAETLAPSHTKIQKIFTHVLIKTLNHSN